MKFLFFLLILVFIVGCSENSEVTLDTPDLMEENSSVMKYTPYVELVPDILKDIEGFKTFDPLSILSNHIGAHQDEFYEGMTYGMLWFLVKDYRSILQEDPSLQGYVDFNTFKLNPVRYRVNNTSFWTDSELIIMDVAQYKLYPSFMGEYNVPNMNLVPGNKGVGLTLPYNLEAAAELASVLITESYSTGVIPKYYVPLAEAYWPMWNDSHFAMLHMVFNKTFKDAGLETSIVGFCPKGQAFSADNYSMLSLYNLFISNTNASLDYYSLVAIDFGNFEEGKGYYNSGLPLEGFMDTLSASCVNDYGYPLKWIIPEAGLKLAPKFRNSDYITNKLEARFKDENVSGVEWVNHIDSIYDFLYNKTGVTYALNALNNPHVIKKIIPFVVEDGFFTFFKDLKGDMVVVKSNDPDVQSLAFRDGDTIRLILNNLIDIPQSLKLKFPNMPVSIKRFYPDEFAVGVIEDTVLSDVSILNLKPKEMAILEFDAVKYPIKDEMSESVYYSSVDTVYLENGKSLLGFVSTSSISSAESVLVRVSYERPYEFADLRPKVKLNGHELEFWPQDSVTHYASQEYDSFTTCLMAYIPKDYLRSRNKFTFEFPDKNPGSFGSLVLRILD
jgi:hypothetical protein